MLPSVEMLTLLFSSLLPTNELLLVLSFSEQISSIFSITISDVSIPGTSGKTSALSVHAVKDAECADTPVTQKAILHYTVLTHNADSSIII